MVIESGQGIVPSPPRTHCERAHFPPDAEDVYAKALSALNDARVPVLIGGALALNRYTGVWRHTKDLDAFLRTEDVPLALSALQDAGFETQTVYASWLAKGWMNDLFVDLIHRNANGLHPVEASWWDHAPSGELLGHPVRYLPVEELVVSKLFVGGRYRFDGADLLHVFYRASDRIDWSRLVARTGEHWQLLLAYVLMYRWAYPAARDRIPGSVLGSLLARLEGERRGDGEGEPAFRGRLLDLVSFSVDVEAWGLPDLHAEILRDLGVPD